MDERPLIIFDGICHFCNGSVNFIIAHDPEGLFAFSPMQCKFARDLIEEYGVNNVGVDSFLLIKDGHCYTYSDAALEVVRELSGFWAILYGLRIVPAPVRNAIYRVFARNRYRLFGKLDACMLPTPEMRKRFIGLDDRF